MKNSSSAMTHVLKAPPAVQCAASKPVTDQEKIATPPNWIIIACAVHAEASVLVNESSIADDSVMSDTPCM